MSYPGIEVVKPLTKCAAKSKGRYSLHAVFFSPSNGHVACTDGSVLALRTLDPWEGPNVTKDAKESAKVGLTAAKDVEGHFPPYEDVVPSRSDLDTGTKWAPVTIEPISFIPLMESLVKLGVSEARFYKGENDLKFTIHASCQDGIHRIEIQTFSVVPLSMDEHPEIAFNPAKILQVLEAAKSLDPGIHRGKLGIKAFWPVLGNDPLVITVDGHGLNSFIGLVMPVNLGK